MAALFGAKKKPLFGNPMDRYGSPSTTPGIGDGMSQPQMGSVAPIVNQPPEQKAGIGTRLFGKGWEDKAFALGGIVRGDPTGAYMMRQDEQMQQRAAQEAAAEQRKRAMDLSDWKWKEDYQSANKPPAAPNLREDNAGNVWQFDAQTGQPLGEKPVWVDPTEKVIYQDGMQIRVPNPYRSGGGTNTANANLPAVSDQASYDAVPAGSQYRDAQGNVRTKQGGPSQPATGNFPRIGPDFLNGLS